MAVSEILTVSIVRTLATKTINEATTFLLKSYAKNKALKDLSIENDDLIASISKLMQVKTLFTGSDKSINLFDFFQKPKLIYNKNELITIDHIEELHDLDNIVFKGTVGQGKSILMRSLVIQDLINNNRIPVFIELKNISKSKNLIDLIKDYLKTWTKNNDEIFEIILQSGKISLFLDAFDEVNVDYLQDTYTEINRLSQNYRKLKIVVSSRPQTIITESPLFNIVSLQPYGIDEQEGLIKKLVSDPDNVRLLIESIHKSSYEVQSVLKTPLMVVLFINQYNVGFSVPQHVTDFYKNIFDVVTFTHDRSKGIEKRISFSSLNQDQLENIFERFCFEAFLVKKSVFDKTLFIELLKKSLEKNNIKDFNDYINLIFDYTRFACLILKDGNSYTFIHKSIQEFYVAKFIEKLPEKLAEKLIEKKLLRNSFRSENYLNFLSILKPYYFNKYFIIKTLDNYQKDVDIRFKNDDTNFYKFIKTIYIIKDNEKHIIMGMIFNEHPIINIFDKELFEIVDVIKELDMINISSIRWLSLPLKDEVIDFNKNHINYDSLNNNIKIRDSWNDICLGYENYQNKVRDIESTISDEDLGI